MFKGAGVNPFSQPHYTDHLAVVCILMGIPLILSQDLAVTLAKKYYPGLDAIQIPLDELTPDTLAAHYNALFLSDLYDRETFHKEYKHLNKQMRVVHCPHGFSDKGFYLKQCAQEDILLIYGQNMIDLIHSEGVWEQMNQYVIVGNYRYTYYLQHKEVQDAIVENEIFSKFQNQQPVILYAPTWQDKELSSTFFQFSEEIIGNLPDQYNLLVKLHPRLQFDDPGTYKKIVNTYGAKPNVVFLDNYPLVFPLLNRTDIYLGDLSSIGYDFLAFNRPMFFLNKDRRNARTDRRLYLFRCGVEVKVDAFPLIYKMIETNLTNDARFTEIRKQTWDYTFGEQKPFEEIKGEIIKACLQ